MKATTFTKLFVQLVASATILCTREISRAQGYGMVTPYTNDANTVLLDHFDGSTLATVQAYVTYSNCNPAPLVQPQFSFGDGPLGLNQGLTLYPPMPNTGRSYLKYPGGELLCQPNGTLECWVYLNTYDFDVHQFSFIGECDGDVGGINATSTGQLQAFVWYDPTDQFEMDSGTNQIPLQTWTHVALTWGSNGAYLYLNDAIVGTNPNTGGFTHWSFPGGTNSVFVTLGAGNSIDELRISNLQRTNFNLPCLTCPPTLDLKRFAGLVIHGPLGSNYNVQATGTLGPTNWTTLANITLASDPYTFIDYGSPTNTQQFYRLTPGN